MHGSKRGAIDWQALMERAKSLAKKVPGILLLLEQLFQAVSSKEQAMQAAPKCPNEHLYCHLEEAIQLNAQALAELLCAHGCCCPDEEDGGNQAQAGTTPPAGQTQAAQGQGGKTQQ